MKKQQAALLSVFSNTTLVILKLVAGILMGSISVLSEAIHSGIDLIASCVAYFSIKKANEPADADHPYGHGKFENISGFFEAILIFVAAGIIIYEAVKKILDPVAMVEKVDWGIAVMVISSIANIFISRTLFKIAKKENSIALEADAMHLSIDVFTSLGVLLGLIVIKFTGIRILDPIIALAVAALILKASWDLTRRSLEDLADKALPVDELELIQKIFSQYPEVKGSHRLRTRKCGKNREIDIHVTVDGSMQVNAAHDLCNVLEREIKTQLPETYVLIHVEPHGGA